MYMSRSILSARLGLLTVGLWEIKVNLKISDRIRHM